MTDEDNSLNIHV